MAFASSLFTSAPALSPRDDGLLSVRIRPTHLIFPRHRLRLGLSSVACGPRRCTESAASKREYEQHFSQFSSKDAEEEEDMDDDAFEALFRELEKDLENDNSLMDDDDEITEEDFVMVERALAKALRSGGDDIELTNARVHNVGNDDDAETDGRDEEEDESTEVEEPEPGSLEILERLTPKVIKS